MTSLNSQSVWTIDQPVNSGQLLNVFKRSFLYSKISYYSYYII
jgi:hypothetical protein